MVFQICTYFLLKASIVIPKVTSRGNPTHFPLFHGHEPGRGNFMNFEKSQKINENSCEELVALLSPNSVLKHNLVFV